MEDELDYTSRISNSLYLRIAPQASVFWGKRIGHDLLTRLSFKFIELSVGSFDVEREIQGTALVSMLLFDTEDM